MLAEETSPHQEVHRLEAAGAEVDVLQAYSEAEAAASMRSEVAMPLLRQQLQVSRERRPPPPRDCAERGKHCSRVHSHS